MRQRYDAFVLIAARPWGHFLHSCRRSSASRLDRTVMGLRSSRCECRLCILVTMSCSQLTHPPRRNRFLDPKDSAALDHKLDSWSSVYARLTGKQVSRHPHQALVQDCRGGPSRLEPRLTFAESRRSTSSSLPLLPSKRISSTFWSFGRSLCCACKAAPYSPSRHRCAANAELEVSVFLPNYCSTSSTGLSESLREKICPVQQM